MFQNYLFCCLLIVRKKVAVNMEGITVWGQFGETITEEANSSSKKQSHLRSEHRSQVVGRGGMRS